MTIKALALAAAFATLTATSGLAATVQLNVVGGQLLGASNVDVNGTLYNVEFVDGTCFALFDGCDEVSDFAFSTMEAVDAALQSLLDTVLLDGALGNFDSNPTLINGLDPHTTGIIAAPFGVVGSDKVETLGLANYFADFIFPDTVFQDTFVTARSLDYSTLSSFAFARFTPTPVPTVPLPAAGLMLFAGLAGLGVLSRRRRPAAAD